MKQEEQLKKPADDQGAATQLEHAAFGGTLMNRAGAAAAEVMLALPGVDVETLDGIRLNLGAALHLRFSQLARSGLGGLVIQDEGCPGLVCDALAANNGSSTYLCGAMVRRPAGPGADGEFALFRSSHNLPGQVELRVSACDNAPAVLVNDGRERSGLPLTDWKCASPEKLPLLRAIGALAGLAEWLSASQKDAALSETVAQILRERSAHPYALLSEEIGQVIQCNREVMGRLGPHLTALLGGGVSAGESFTFGKLANCLMQSGGESPLELFYGWYNPLYKRAVGVPAENLTDERIADTDTVLLGAEGLLKKTLPPQRNGPGNKRLGQPGGRTGGSVLGLGRKPRRLWG